MSTMRQPSRAQVRLYQGVLRWFFDGEVGASSQTIAWACCGVGGPIRYKDFPLDPDDLRRCVLLLEAVPGLRRRFGRLRKVSAVWAQLVDHWDELTALLAEEMKAGVHAPRTYRRMHELQEAGRRDAARAKREASS